MFTVGCHLIFLAMAASSYITLYIMGFALTWVFRTYANIFGHEGSRLGLSMKQYKHRKTVLVIENDQASRRALWEPVLYVHRPDTDVR